MIILAQMLILSEYPHDKKNFTWFTSITDSFKNYKRVGLCPMQNKDNSVSSTVLSKSFHLIDFELSQKVPQ